jgi:ADP-ribose pyrophosphatase
MPQPWKRIGSDRESDYRILKIREELAINPRNGTEHRLALVECPDWVNVIPVTTDGQLVFIRQFRFGIWDTTLEIPGGMLEPGESPADAAARELEEETGYRADRIESLGFVHPNPAFQTNRCHSFLALDCRKVHAGRQDSGEDISVELYRREDLPRLLGTEVTHALVLVAFLFERLREGGAR